MKRPALIVAENVLLNVFPPFDWALVVPVLVTVTGLLQVVFTKVITSPVILSVAERVNDVVFVPKAPVRAPVAIQVPLET